MGIVGMPEARDAFQLVDRTLSVLFCLRGKAVLLAIPRMLLREAAKVDGCRRYWRRRLAAVVRLHFAALVDYSSERLVGLR